MSFTLYCATQRGDTRNTLYPRRRVVTSFSDLQTAARFDHVAAEFEGSRRSLDGFKLADCIVLDEPTAMLDPQGRREVLDISACFNDILERRDLPKYVRRNLKQLGACLGRFDLEGQVQGLEAVRCQCRQDLARLQENGPQRMRNYQILALCAGAALAILFI